MVGLLMMMVNQTKTSNLLRRRPLMMRFVAVFYCIPAAITFSLDAHAQSGTFAFDFFKAQTLISPTIPTGYDRGANVDLDSKPRPDFDALPVNIGAFNIYSQLDTFVGTSSNALLSQNNPKSDVLLGGAISAFVKADFGSSTFIAFGRDWENVWLHNAVRSQDQGNIDASYQFDISDSLNGAVEGAFFRYGDNNPIGVLNDLSDILLMTQKTFAATRIQYQTGHISEILSLDRTHFNLDPIYSSLTGLEQTYYYDHSVLRITSQTEFAFTPSFAIFVQANAYRTSYSSLLPGNNPNYQSLSYRGIAGLSLDFAGILRGQISAGFGHRNFDSPQYHTPTGFVIASKIEFFPDELDNLTLVALKDYDDGSIYALAPVKYQNFTAIYEHELRENFLVGFQVNDNKQTALVINSGVQVNLVNYISQSQYSFGGSFNINYHFNHHISVKFEIGGERFTDGRNSVVIVDSAPNTEIRGQITLTFRP